MRGEGWEEGCGSVGVERSECIEVEGFRWMRCTGEEIIVAMFLCRGKTCGCQVDAC